MRGEGTCAMATRMAMHWRCTDARDAARVLARVRVAQAACTGTAGASTQQAAGAQVDTCIGCRWTRSGRRQSACLPRGRWRCRLAQRGQAEAKREAAIRLLLREEDGAAPKQRPTIAATYAATVHAWLCLGSRNCRHLCCHCQTCRLPHATGATKRPLLPPAAGRRSFCSRDLPIV